jgi:hypothetical protein
MNQKRAKKIRKFAMRTYDRMDPKIKSKFSEMTLYRRMKKLYNQGKLVFRKRAE